MKADGAVAEEVAGLAQVVVEQVPACVFEGAEEPFEDGAQPAAGVLRREGVGRFDEDDADGEDDGEPDSQPPVQAVDLGGG